MKKILFLVGLLLSCSIVYSQGDNPAGAPAITTNFWSMGVLSSGTLAGATGSGLTGYCAAAPNNDVFYSFVATSQGVKVTGITTAFDMVIELRDASFN